VTDAAVPHPPISRAGFSQLVRAAGHEAVLAQIGLAVIAVHVLDDNFLQPQPGTSAADHLVSGLFLLAVLLGVAVIYPKLRAGLRGLLGVTLGIFGVVAGLEAFYYAREVGASGDDYTGFMSIPAGLLLIGVAVVTLWRTRRRDDRLPRRYLRRLLLGVGAVVVGYVVLASLMFTYVLTHAARAVVPRPDLGAPHEQVAFTTSDGLRLRGWYVPSKNRAAVIAFPGRRGPQRQTRMLVRHGYGVLLFDRRGEGESEGDPNAFGWAGTRDLDAAVDFLRTRRDIDRDRIGGIGLSVGGEMLLQAAAESDDFAAVVSEGAGVRSVREAVGLGWGKALEVGISGVATVGTALFGNDLPPPSLEDLVTRIAPRPVFFIYATHGQGGEELNVDFHAAAREPKILWEISQGKHTGGITAQPKEYERRVIGFFDRALLSATSG
jgi:uncharacterized protein